NDETEEKGPDAHDVRRRRYARRGQQRKQEEGDQSEVDGRQGERQGSDRLEAEEGVLVVRPELERSGTESANASRDAVIGPYDGRQGEGDQGKGDDLENGREEFQWREGRVQIEHDGRGAPKMAGTFVARRRPPRNTTHVPTWGLAEEIPAKACRNPKRPSGRSASTEWAVSHSL